MSSFRPKSRRFPFNSNSRHRTTLMVALAAGLSLTACSSDAPKTPDTTPSSATQDSLQAAARQAQTQQRPTRYITREPGEGYLTPEIINASESLSGKTLSSPKISPDGEFITVLQGREDDARQQDLWAYDLSTGEGRLLVSSTDILGEPEVLSEEEKNRRERAREYGKGIVTYSWVGDNLLLFPLGGDIYLYNLETQESQQVTATKGFETDPKVSANGQKVAYVRDNELYIKDIKSGLERQLSDGATETIRNATASFVVQEELDRNTGFWLSPQAKNVAYTQIDESEIAIENRLDFGADGVENISQRYPFAGTANATVKLGVVSAEGGKTRWLDLGPEEDIYLTRVIWDKDGDSLVAGILSRDNKTHTFRRYNIKTGRSEEIYTETSPTWLNIGTDLRAEKDGSLLWSAERNNLRQIFRIGTEGEIKALTPETMNVHNLLCKAGDTGDLYVSGWQDTPLEQHIFRISQSDGSETSKDMEEDETPESEASENESTENGENEDQAAPFSGTVTQITTRPGQHSARFNSDCSRFIGTFSGVNTPSQTRAFEADGTPLAWLNENSLDSDHPYAPYLENHITPEFGQITGIDGTPLDYMLFKPLDLKPGQQRASITIVYGGPGVQRVKRNFRNQFAQMLAHHGFVVFQIDGRGATNRGKEFEDDLYRAMGTVEVTDQIAGADFLRAQSFIDEDRMGVYGWSYGGYMTLHMLGQTDIYASGVAGAPVTDWSLYDTAYTERYLGSPDPESENYTEGAYEDGSVFAHIDGLTEPVLLIHGMADDNVVFRHSIKFMEAMQMAGKQNLRLMTYPGEKHGFRKTENRIHRDRQILEFFLETLDLQQTQ
ncbi:DPP IV N-terminal domain-containing protein [Litorimonas sp.]|uniref:S9 family peptidase n=1 Tax=Litorimonas sp. TaxID=1892381 RepID=UPI003A8680A6